MSRHWRDKPASRSLPPICFLEGNETKSPVGPWMILIFRSITVVKDNAHVGFDQILVDWMDCNLGDLHACSEPEYHCLHAA